MKNIIIPFSRLEFFVYYLFSNAFLKLFDYFCFKLLIFNNSILSNIQNILNIFIGIVIIIGIVYTRLFDITENYKTAFFYEFGIVSFILLILFLSKIFNSISFLFILAWLVFFIVLCIIKGHKTKVHKVPIVIGFILTCIIYSWLCINTKTCIVKSDRMYPTFQKKDMVSCTIVINDSILKRGDIVAYTIDDSKATHVSRVIGLPNEEVQIYEDKITINNELFNDKYNHNNISNNNIFNNSIKLNNDSYFLLNDNRNNIDDSRKLGAIRKEQIKLKIRTIYYPLNRRQKL